MHWTIILLFLTQSMTVHGQTWVGVFIVNSTCDLNSCCCFTNSIGLSSPSADVLAFNVSLAGAYCGDYTSYMAQAAYPTGYSSTLSISIITLTIVLSSDSNMLTITSSLGSSCGAEAERMFTVVESTTTTPHPNPAAAEHYVNHSLMFILAFFSIVIIR